MDSDCPHAASPKETGSATTIYAKISRCKAQRQGAPQELTISLKRDIQTLCVVVQWVCHSTSHKGCLNPAKPLDLTAGLQNTG